VAVAFRVTPSAVAAVDSRVAAVDSWAVGEDSTAAEDFMVEEGTTAAEGITAAEVTGAVGAATTGRVFTSVSGRLTITRTLIRTRREPAGTMTHTGIGFPAPVPLHHTDTTDIEGFARSLAVAARKVSLKAAPQWRTST
jgi:hypothetical protein